MGNVHMNYELARRLKDAGFVYGNQMHRAYKPDGTFRNLGDKPDGDYIYEPTLSELIEACGDRFDVLFQTNQKYWYCIYNNMEKATDSYQTPEEAVVNLWLKLNKK